MWYEYYKFTYNNLYIFPRSIFSRNILSSYIKKKKKIKYLKERLKIDNDEMKN